MNIFILKLYSIVHQNGLSSDVRLGIVPFAEHMHTEAILLNLRTVCRKNLLETGP